MSGNNNYYNRWVNGKTEEAIKVVTDANNNIYTISSLLGLVRMAILDPFTIAETEFDYVIKWFACDGSLQMV
jgi:hypothetical protein